jgi:protein involved in polysaccharide export with SLBB domain
MKKWYSECMKNNNVVTAAYCRYLLCLILSVFSVVSFADTLSEGDIDTSDIASAYTLGYGDMVSIKVYGEEDLSVDAELNNVGVISFPFLGEIRVYGLTVAQVQNKIAEGLRDGYLVDPKVSVSLTAYRQFYVNGEVKQPGGFQFSPKLTVRKAISLAGGFTARAAKNKIFIVSDGGNTSEPQRVDLNTSIKPGDVITVKQRFF